VLLFLRKKELELEFLGEKKMKLFSLDSKRILQCEAAIVRAWLNLKGAIKNKI
jgi:hypothetical protein